MSRSLIVAVLALPLLVGGCSSVGNDHSPYPNSYGEHFAGVQGKKLEGHVDTLGHILMNVNNKYPPYDTYGSALGRDWTTIVKTLDWKLMGTDWDDPYID